MSEFAQGDPNDKDEALLDQRVFALQPHAFEELAALLDAPGESSDKLAELLARKPPWQQ